MSGTPIFCMLRNHRVLYWVCANKRAFVLCQRENARQDRLDVLQRGRGQVFFRRNLFQHDAGIGGRQSLEAAEDSHKILNLASPGVLA